jgi:hypothetical protein
MKVIYSVGQRQDSFSDLDASAAPHLIDGGVQRSFVTVSGLTPRELIVNPGKVLLQGNGEII